MGAYPDHKNAVRFSLILPSRCRPDLLKRLVDSVTINTKRIESVEILVGIDDDDTETIAMIGRLNCIFHVRKRGNSISVDYQNWLYNFSRGKYCFVLNDDCEIITEWWDEIAWNKLERCSFPSFSYGWV